LAFIGTYINFTHFGKIYTKFYLGLQIREQSHHVMLLFQIRFQQLCEMSLQEHLAQGWI